MALKMKRPNQVQAPSPVQAQDAEKKGFDACFTQLKTVEGILSDMSSKLLPNGAPSDHPLPSIGELNKQCQDRHTSEENAYSNAISSAISTSDTSFVKGNTESRVSSSSTLTEMGPPLSGIGDSQYSQPDVNQGAAAFSQVSNRHLLTPHQGHLPKHQETERIEGHGKQHRERFRMTMKDGWGLSFGFLFLFFFLYFL
ncbi:hypothetical protein LOK49_LG13G00320 [Camellia lanceoleosa]|uniref:Uncharacterized protein n=1 Tax=Camellia lanceoleosa TaxID=1840588 RepID=A0ACC0FNV1_9ERIC|nr:hypothetical protein LOK49_LG13G00320 [Camellia lanceoleosa]